MFFYVIRRIIGAGTMLVIMSMVTFLLFYATPTDPARLTCGKNCTPTGIEQNRKYLGLDQPLPQQYLAFAGGLIHERLYPNDKQLQKKRPDLIIHCAAPCLGYSPLRISLIWTYLKPRVPVTISLSIGGIHYLDLRRRLTGHPGLIAPRQDSRPYDRLRRRVLLFVPDVLHLAAALATGRFPSPAAQYTQLRAAKRRARRLPAKPVPTLPDARAGLRRRICSDHPAPTCSRR